MQENNYGVKGRDMSAEELHRETGADYSVQDTLREQDRRRRGRPMLRWEDCVKRDVRKAGEEEDCKKKTRDRVGWTRLSDDAVKKLWAAPHP